VDDKDLEQLEQQEAQEQKETEAANKTAHVAGKAAATYFGGKAGAEAYDAISKTQLGKKLEEKAGESIKNNRQLNKAAQKLNDSGALDAADQVMDMGNKSQGTPKTPSSAGNGKPQSTPNAGPTTNNSSDSGTGTTKLPENAKPATISIIVILLFSFIPFFIIAFIISIIIALLGGGRHGVAMNGYYAMRCPEVTVTFVDENYVPTEVKTYPFEEYIAGVVGGEVGHFNSPEVYKAFAISARTYFFSAENNCSIESSDRYQVCKEENITDAIRTAVEETKGKVLLREKDIFQTEYDAFACIDKDNDYYTIAQQNQKLPITWINSRINVNSKPEWFICDGILREHHGRGMSQYGSLYLAEEKGYTYDEILAFYYGDDVTISSGYLTSIAGLEVKNTTSSSVIDDTLGELLNENGASIEDMNGFIKESVESVGKGTRAGVVAAAVSQINYLYDNFGKRLPYYWGGAYTGYGVYKELGGATTPIISKYGTCYTKKGFDCSGFVSWAIKNGGYKFGRYSTVDFHNVFSGDSCDITDQNCIGQPGDLINSRDCHVQMIVAVDEASGKYMIVESTGSMGVVMREWNMHSIHYGYKTRILHMDSFYNNPNNVDPNY
jgi:spoIID/lytB domain protein